MATIIFEGIILSESVKTISEETNFHSFRVSENVGTSEKPNYVYYDCAGSFSEKQRNYLVKDTIVEVIGEIKGNHAYLSGNNNNEPRASVNVSVLKFNLKGKVKREPKAE